MITGAPAGQGRQKLRSELAEAHDEIAAVLPHQRIQACCVEALVKDDGRVLAPHKVLCGLVTEYRKSSLASTKSLVSGYQTSLVTAQAGQRVSAAYQRRLRPSTYRS